jgi:hypothetical protein
MTIRTKKAGKEHIFPIIIICSNSKSGILENSGSGLWILETQPQQLLLPRQDVPVSSSKLKLISYGINVI